MSVEVSGEITAFATAVLAAFAIVTAVFAEQNDREIRDRRRDQASRVFIWHESGPDPRLTDAQIENGVPWREGVTAHIENTSGQPVDDLTIDWYRGSAPWGEPEHRTVLLPGDKTASTRTFPEDPPATADHTQFTPAARFRDAAAVHWLLRPAGQLDEEPPSGTARHLRIQGLTWDNRKELPPSPIRASLCDIARPRRYCCTAGGHVSAPVLQARVSGETLARVDDVRGDTRSAWLQRLIDRELNGLARRTSRGTRRSSRPPRRVTLCCSNTRLCA